MKALTYHGAFEVQVDHVLDPVLEHAGRGEAARGYEIFEKKEGRRKVVLVP